MDTVVVFDLFYLAFQAISQLVFRSSEKQHMVGYHTFFALFMTRCDIKKNKYLFS